MTRISLRLPRDRSTHLWLAFALALVAAAFYAASQGAFPAEASPAEPIVCHQTSQQNLLLARVTHYACPMGGHVASATISWHTTGLSLINLRLACKPSYNRDVLAVKSSGRSTFSVNRNTHSDLYAVMRASSSCTFYVTMTARKAVKPQVKKSSP